MYDEIGDIKALEQNRCLQKQSPLRRIPFSLYFEFLNTYGYQNFLWKWAFIIHLTFYTEFVIILFQTI